MPNPTNPEHIHTEGLTERELTMLNSEWIVEVANWAQLGTVVATFNHHTGSDPFIGTAEMTVVDGVRKLEITLLYEEAERFRCWICNNIPVWPTVDNPGICAFCGVKVCLVCSKKHEREHWRPQYTIGGDIMCDGDKVRCGRDKCPLCGGSPF
jgi:hypothetical protein